jgi:hypothetical protein
MLLAASRCDASEDRVGRPVPGHTVPCGAGDERSAVQAGEQAVGKYSGVGIRAQAALVAQFLEGSPHRGSPPCENEGELRLRLRIWPHQFARKRAQSAARSLCRRGLSRPGAQVGQGPERGGSEVPDGLDRGVGVQDDHRPDQALLAIEIVRDLRAAGAGRRAYVLDARPGDAVPRERSAPAPAILARVRRPLTVGHSPPGACPLSIPTPYLKMGRTTHKARRLRVTFRRRRGARKLARTWATQSARSMCAAPLRMSCQLACPG